MAVEKLDISDIREKFGDRKCLSVQRKSFVGHPNAIYFLQISLSEFFNSHRRLHHLGIAGEMAMVGLHYFSC